MPRKRKSRIYWRERGGVARAYGDFRDYADVGGRLEALIPDGSRTATEDPDEAAGLLSARLEELEKGRRGVRVAKTRESAKLKNYASSHLVKKRKAGTSERHLVNLQGQLQVVVDHFGANRELGSISTKDVEAWMGRLRQTPNKRGGKLSEATCRKYLVALSDLFKRAVSDGEVEKNPAAALYDKPKPEKRPARYFENHEVALLLESARTLLPEPVQHGRGNGGAATADRYPYIYPLLVTAAYTGLRKSELFGLLVDDISFRLGVVFVQPNDWRGLKTESSERQVPLWPELERILREYLLEREREAPLGALLFPSHRSEEEKMLDNVDRMLDKVGARAGIRKPRLHAFRHSYTAARMQTLEHGAPIHIWHVARELGHTSANMIEKKYGHLTRVPDRSEVVRFSVENAPRQDREEVQRRLKALLGTAPTA